MVSWIDRCGQIRAEHPPGRSAREIGANSGSNVINENTLKQALLVRDARDGLPESNSSDSSAAARPNRT